jgi:hypothetical protein
VAQIANTFILRRNIGELLELGARKIVFFEWNEVHSSPRLKHENEFYRVREGDLFGALQNKAFLIRLIAHSIAPAPMSERALVVRCAGVPVTNRNREEFKQSLDGFGSDVGNVHWNFEWFGFVKIRRPADSRLV